MRVITLLLFMGITCMKALVILRIFAIMVGTIILRYTSLWQAPRFLVPTLSIAPDGALKLVSFQ